MTPSSYFIKKIKHTSSVEGKTWPKRDLSTPRGIYIKLKKRLLIVFIKKKQTNKKPFFRIALKNCSHSVKEKFSHFNG